MMKLINNNIAKWFLIIAVPVIAIWSVIVINNAVHEKRFLSEKAISTNQINDAHISALVEKDMAEITENLKVVRDANEFNDFLNNASDKNYQEAVQLFVRIMANKSGYDQLRYIDKQGDEVIRVDNKQEVVVTPSNKLQSKAERYYFINTMSLHYNEVYVSPLDLNVENGQIEVPHKPTLRFSTPVYDANQNLRGILIINYKAKGFIELIELTPEYQSSSSLSSFEFYILNRKGQYIVHPDKKKRFSFMFEKTREASLKEDNPPLWRSILKSDGIGNDVDNTRLYSYYDVLNDSRKNNAAYKQRWILLHAIDTTELLSWKTMLHSLFLTANALIFMVIILLSLVLAYIVDRLILTDRQLEITTKIADSTSDAVVITDAATRIIYANKSYEEATGYQLDELIGLRTSQFQSGKQDKQFYMDMWRSINKTGRWEGMLWDKNRQGLLSPKQLKIIAIKSKKNHIVDKYVGIFTDLSANKMKSDTLELLKQEDGQSIIPNESMMIELLHQSVKNRSVSFTIVYLAIENFNHLISLFDGDSNYVSDIFISAVNPFLQESDVVAQAGRNVFAVIIEVNHITGEPESFIRDFHKALGKVRHVDGQDIFFKTRIGVSYWPQDTNDIKKLLLNSMIALEWTIHRQESEIAFFNESMIAELNQENEIEGQLRKAIENKELSVVYQPQIDIRSEQIIGMEALLRWHNKALGHVSPAVFIPIAEKSNLMIDIGDWVIETVCTDLNTLKKHSGIAQHKLKCAINISVIQMEDSHFVDQFFACISANKIQSHELEVELTESVLLTNEKKNIEVLSKIRKQGISIAIDDFGSGYSSLSYLNTLPIDKIKIDRSFIKNYPESDDGALARILVDMSKKLQMEVLTEGAETKEQVAYLRSIGCDYIQGYYYSKPLPLDELIHIYD